MKVSKEYRIEMEAMSKALEIAKEKGIEGLEDELKMRGAVKLPLTISRARGEAWLQMANKQTLETVLLLTLVTIQDEFGFGAKRLNHFIDRYAEKTECMAKGYVDWEDLQEEMREKLKVDFHISELVSGHRAKEVSQKREQELDELVRKIKGAK